MSLTCVTGYWNIKNKHGNKFEDWFENTLAVNNPYIIFSDKSLIDMAANRPATLDQFGDVFGVGEGKKKEFGKKFLEFIAAS